MGHYKYNKKKVSDCIALTFDDFSQLYGLDISAIKAKNETEYVSQMAEDLVAVLTCDLIKLKDFEAEIKPLRNMEDDMD